MVLLINRCQPVALWSCTGHGLVPAEGAKVVVVGIKPGLQKVLLAVLDLHVACGSKGVKSNFDGFCCCSNHIVI